MENTDNRWLEADARVPSSPLDRMHYVVGSTKGASPVDTAWLALGNAASKSEMSIKTRTQNEISNEGRKKLTTDRQAYYAEATERYQLENGRYRPDLSVSSGSSRMNKTAAVNATTSPFSGHSNSTHIGPDPYSPVFLTQNLQLPRDRITANAWNRAFYETNPIVRNAINLHATYPISKLTIKCDNREVEKFFLDMADRIDLENVVQQVALEYFKLGEKIKGSTLITMADGSVKPIKDIVVGDYVLTHLGNRKKVIDVFVKPTNSVIEKELKILKIKFNGLRDPLVISGNHPMLSINRAYFVCNTPSCSAKGMRLLPGKHVCSNCGKTGFFNDKLPDFIGAQSLSVGDTIYAPFNTDVVEDDRFNDELCYLMGQWLAEGCYCKAPRKHSTIVNGIKFCSYDKNYIYEILEPLLSRQFGFDPATYISKSRGFSGALTNKTKNKYDTWFQGKYKNGPEIAQFFFEHCGEYSKEKKLSEAVMSLPPDLQLHILAGFLDGDGCIDPNNGHGILTTSSANLANQLLLIARRTGFHPTFNRDASNIKGVLTGGTNYRIQLVANEVKNLLGDKIKSTKVRKLIETRWSSPRSALQNCWQVLSINKIEDITADFNDPFMYDIEVEDDHSYVAAGVAVHNCFIDAAFDEATGTWDQIFIHNPDFIRVKSSPIPTKSPSISLRPDPELIKIVNSSDPEHARIREQMDPKILNHVIRNEYIPLDNFNTSHLKHLNAPYDVRGTSMIVSIWKDLMLYDKLREAKFVQADGMVNPITLVKIGTDGPEGFYPRQEELEAMRQVFEVAQNDKDFKIFTHNAVAVERVGFSGATLDVGADFAMIIDNILMGLMVPKSILTQEGASYASASVALDVMRQRYNSFRTMMSNWLEKKIFAPISEIQGFYDLDTGNKRLIVPTIEWNHMTLYDMDNYIAQVSTLVEKQRVSQRTLDRSLGLTRGNELTAIREEMIEQAIQKQEMAALQQMTLAELRSLDPEEPIIAPEKQALPGMKGGPGSGGSDGGLGGLPPMGGGDMMGGMGGLGGGLGGGLPPMPPMGGAPPDLGPPPPGGGGMGAIPGGATPPTPPIK